MIDIDKYLINRKAGGNMFRAKEQILNLPDMQMRYITFGKGPKTMIMIQGLNTNGIHGAAASLAFMYRMFAKEYTVYLFDRREDLAAEVTVRDLAADLAKAMDALELKRADVFGVSQGGMIAQYLAIDRPDLVHKLVLAVTLSRTNPTVEIAVNNWIDLTQKKDYKTLVIDMAEKLYSEAYLKQYRQMLPLLTLVQKPKDPEKFITLAKACLTCNAYEELTKIKCPVLVLAGEKDLIVTKEASEEMVEKLLKTDATYQSPRVWLHIYEGLGHAAYEEAKDFNKRILEFFQEA